MKKLFLLVTIFITSIFTLKAQVSDLSDLASGSLEMFVPISELNGDIYGYFTIYKLDNISKTEEKYEYVLLDKNLNKVANGEFVDVRYKRHFFETRFLSPEKSGTNLIISKVHYNYLNAKYTFMTHRILDLTKNEMSDPFYYKDGEITDGIRDVKKIKGLAKRQSTFEYPLVFSEGFFMFEKIKSKAGGNLKDMKSLKAFGIDKKLKWEYEYNPDRSSLNYAFEAIDEENVIFWTFNTKTKSEKLHRLNPKTGEVIFLYELENKSSEYNHVYRLEILEDRLVIVGKMSAYKKSGYNYKKALGVFRIELDKEGKELSKKYFTWNKANEFMEIKENGKMKGGYRLRTKKYFVFKDGSISILTEKWRDNTDLFIVKVLDANVTDFVMFNFDADFNLKSVDVIEKDKTKGYSSDYLFSQKIEDGKGVAFFYSDNKKVEGKKKEKNWVLGIVTIKEGKMNHEQIPMSSEDHFIYPYIAKEGYILLREFNKDADYDQIRLERLNY